MGDQQIEQSEQGDRRGKPELKDGALIASLELECQLEFHLGRKTWIKQKRILQLRAQEAYGEALNQELPESGCIIFPSLTQKCVHTHTQSKRGVEERKNTNWLQTEKQRQKCGGRILSMLKASLILQ